ncbi:MAG: efflux RND transporter periplasmic adaptor subunit [Ignavibacteriae bacterium]|nr:efflux RND transporter periplasmic adaptor subunit [Ignavibacteriota bacterium]
MKLLDSTLKSLKNKKVAFSLLGGIALILAYIIMSALNKEAIASADVRRGEFLISIKTSGEIRATNSLTITTPRLRYGQMQIIYLTPEGTTVKPGDVIVRFGTTDVDKMISDKQSESSISQSDLAKFRADKALRSSELEGNLRNAELQYEQANLQLEKTKFEAELQKREAEIGFERNRIAFEQAKRKIESQHVVDKSEEKKLTLKLQQIQGDLTRAQEDKELFTVKATLGGLVVYEDNWSTGRKIAVGDQPWGGMPIVSLPDLSKMQSMTSVSEVEVSKVKKGQKVRVRLDAFPEKEFAGILNSVATIGQQRNQSNLKTFEVIVDIDGTDPILKPGMTTSNEIIMSSLRDTLFVPIEAVFEKDGKTVVYRTSGSSARPQEVTLGAKNSNFVIVNSGLKPGDKVALRDPTINETGTSAQSAGEKSK